MVLGVGAVDVVVPVVVGGDVVVVVVTVVVAGVVVVVVVVVVAGAVLVGKLVVDVAPEPLARTVTLSTFAGAFPRRNSMARVPAASVTGMSTVRHVPQLPVDASAAVVEMMPFTATARVAPVYGVA